MTADEILAGMADGADRIEQFSGKRPAHAYMQPNIAARLGGRTVPGITIHPRLDAPPGKIHLTADELQPLNENTDGAGL